MKGGVGKTTTVVSLAETLATDPGTPVLVIDIDTQANASYCFAGDKILAELIRNDRTIDEFFQKRLVDNIPCDIDGFVRRHVSNVTHLDQPLDVSLLASSPHLRLTEREIIHTLTARKYSMNAIEGRTTEILKPAMERFKKEYKYILFDCAPGISAFTASAIASSDLIIIPTIPDFMSYLGLSAFADHVLQEARTRETQREAWVLVTKKNGTTQHATYHNKIKEAAGKPDALFSLFETTVSESASFPRAMNMINENAITYLHKYQNPADRVLARCFSC